MEGPCAILCFSYMADLHQTHPQDRFTSPQGDLRVWARYALLCNIAAALIRMEDMLQIAGLRYVDRCAPVAQRTGADFLFRKYHSHGSHDLLECSRSIPNKVGCTVEHMSDSSHRDLPKMDPLLPK